MAIDTHTFSATNTYVAATPLVDRLMDILGITTASERRIFSQSHTVSAGFTIENVAQVLPPLPPTSTPSSTPKLLGWLFIFPTLEMNDPNAALVAKIEVKKLEMIVASGGISMSADTPLINNGSPVNILPKIFYQKNPVLQPTDYNSSYPVSFDFIEPKYVDDPELHISRLDDFENWAELSLYGRGDLDLMKAYFDAGFNAYNDIFFSGARVNYHMMHNPKLRVQQKTFVSPVTQAPVPGTSSRAFTLKAEPFITSNNNVSKGDSVPPILGPGDTVNKNAASTVASPMVAMMEPCPDYWDLIGGISTQAAYVESGINPDNQLMLAGALLNENPSTLIGSTFSAPLTIPSVLTTSPRLPQRGFLAWLLSCWNSIRNFLSSLFKTRG